MWRVYRRTRKDEDYKNYKETLNAATNEAMEKLACNINKNDSNSFMHIPGVNKMYETRWDH